VDSIGCEEWEGIQAFHLVMKPIISFRRDGFGFVFAKETFRGKFSEKFITG
jgi:hypothetical protein